MIEALKAFFEVLGTAQRDGWGGTLVLWIFILVTLVACWLAIRAYRGANDSRIEALSERLDDCEAKHERQLQALEQGREKQAKLQRKLALVAGLLIAQLGNRQLPDGFLQIILNDDIEEVPDIGSAAPG